MQKTAIIVKSDPLLQIGAEIIGLWSLKIDLLIMLFFL